MFLFVGGAVVAFALIGAVASGGFRHPLRDEPSDVMALGSSISFFSVGLAVGSGLVVGWLLNGFTLWALGSFFATVVYLLVFALEMSVAEKLRSDHPKEERKIVFGRAG